MGTWHRGRFLFLSRLKPLLQGAARTCRSGFSRDRKTDHIGDASTAQIPNAKFLRHLQPRKTQRQANRKHLAAAPPCACVPAFAARISCSDGADPNDVSPRVAQRVAPARIT